MTSPLQATLTATLIAAMAAPALAGGPVILEEAEVVAEAPRSGANVAIALVLVGIAVAVLMSGEDEDMRKTRRTRY